MNLNRLNRSHRVRVVLSSGGWGARVILMLMGMLIAALVVGCAGPRDAGPIPDAPVVAGTIAKALATGPVLQAIDLSDPLAPVAGTGAPIELLGAKNEWISFAVQVSNLPRLDPRRPLSLRVGALNKVDSPDVIPTSLFSAYHVVPMPVDVNRASFVRHTGLTVSDQRLPRAMLPAPVGDGGLINLSALQSVSGAKRDPGLTSLKVWIELRIPAPTRAGEYVARCDLLQSGKREPLGSVDVKLTVFDFVLPDERHLTMVGQLDWQSLREHYPSRFESITPRLMNRMDARYAPAVQAIDQLVKLAQAHRAQVVVPRLQPTVKWPSGQPPQVDWSDFDSLIGPWMKGDAFADNVGLGFWPLPEEEYLDRFDRASQLQYWQAAA